MKELPEWVSKEYLERHGINTPNGTVLSESDELPDISYPVAIKAQVPVESRKEKGGIQFAQTKREAEQILVDLFGNTIEGYDITTLIVEEKLDPEAELYVAISADGTEDQPRLLFSDTGGSGVEAVSQESLASVPIDPLVGLHPYHFRTAVAQVAEQSTAELLPTEDLGSTATSLWTVFNTFDLQLLEINPLAIHNQELVALDAKCIIDDAATFRQNHSKVDSKLTGLEKTAEQAGIHLREGSGNIGILTTGAGTGLATVDLIAKQGEELGVFIDIHGSKFTEVPFAEYLPYFTQSGVEVIIANISGSLIDCREVSEQIADQSATEPPIVARFNGPNQEAAVDICKAAGIASTCELPDAVTTAIATVQEDR